MSIEDFEVALCYQHGKYFLLYIASDKQENNLILLVDSLTSGGYRNSDIIQKTYPDMNIAMRDCAEYLI